MITYSIIITISVNAYFIRWLSGTFSDELNRILFFVSLLVISISWELVRWINLKLNDILPFEKGISKRLVVQLLTGIVIAFTIRYSIYKFGEPYLPVKLDPLFLATTWALYALTIAGINLVFFVRYFIGRWKDSLIKAERLEKEKSQVQFDNLKNQLNPHFLFNALTSLNSLIVENPALAQQFLQHMSKVYRYVLQNKERNFVSMETELDFIQNYVFLAKTRFENALNIRFDVAENMKEKVIVPVTLQILIENALKHNIVDDARPLSIEVITSSEYLVVTNNLQLRNRVETSNKQGLDNLKSLYAFFKDKPVIIEQDEQRFSVKVPLL